MMAKPDETERCKWAITDGQVKCDIYLEID